MRIFAAAVVGIVGIAISAGCSRQVEPPTVTSSFLIGVDPDTLQEPARSTVASADKNIALVLRGQPPECEPDLSSALSDGGTITYKCSGYALTVVQRIYQLGDVLGAIYGPVVEFPGGDFQIAHTRFYSNEELRALMDSGNGL